MLTVYLIAFACVLAALRIGGVTTVPYQAVAHCYVGGLIGAGVAMWFAERTMTRIASWVPTFHDACNAAALIGDLANRRRVCLWTAAGLVAVEVVVFVVSRVA